MEHLETLNKQIQNNLSITERNQETSDNGIHKLPSELLLRIFQVGEELDRATRPRELWYLGMQDLATQVCSHWRYIAINCPSLWAHIHITRPGPHDLASLYLSRVGPVTLLDVNIEMRARFCDELEIEYDDWKRQREAIPELLKFLASHGAPINRWKSLSLCALEPDVLLRFIGILCTEAAPALRFLSCKLSPNHEGDSSEERIIRDPQYSSESYQLSPFAVPSLRCVDFDRLSWSYVFDRTLPVFSGLTELRLTAWSTLCSPAQLQELLSFNPQLESLSLTTSNNTLEILDEIELITQRIQMTRLHTLSVNTITNLTWALSVLQMIDAPVLKKLSISSFVPTKTEDILIANLARFKCEYAEVNPASSELLYPSLDELDIHNFTLYREQVIDMFISWPSITRLFVSRAQVEPLEDPLLLPRLSYLKVDYKTHPQLGNILSSREAAGNPVKVVDLPANRWREELEEELPSSVTILEHRAFEFEIDYDDSATEAESWIHDDYDSYSSGSEESEWIWGVHESDS